MIIKFDWAAPAGVEIVLLLPLPPVKRCFLRRLGECGQDTVVTVTKLEISNRKCCHICEIVQILSTVVTVGDSNSHQVWPVALLHASAGDRGGRRGVGGRGRHG